MKCRYQHLSGKVERAGSAVVIRIIGGYRRLVSPLLPPSCRFTPTCSEYAIDAIRKHGLAKGTALAFLRLLKCHPLHPGGVDPA